MRVGAEGFALVAVLAVLAVAAALAAAALQLSRAGAGAAAGYTTEVEGGHAAEAGLRLAAVRLADAEGYALAELSSAPLDWHGWRVDVRVEDEAAKLDINRAAPALLLRSLRDMGATPTGGVDLRGRRFAAVDALAAALGLDAAALPRLRRGFTVYGGDDPAPPGPRSALETYRIVATARRGDRAVGRWAILRVSAGFGAPFEWLERGDDMEPSRSLNQK